MSPNNDVRHSWLRALLAAATAVGITVGGAPAPAGPAAAAPAHTAHSTAPLRPAALTVGDQTRPLNVEGTPLFGWQPRDRDPGEVQTAYQVRVREAATGRQVWDSGRVASDQQSYVEYTGPDLTPGAAYTWQVRTWDRTDLASPWSPDGRFETGIGDADWEGASWIRRATTEADDYTLARTEVTVPEGRVVRARAYTASNHTYELLLNGRRADRGASFGYPGEGYYQAADVTDLVRAGEQLAIGVRYHWYGAGQGRPAAEPGLLHKLVIELADGTRQVVTTGGDWTVTRDTRFVAGAERRNGEGDRIDHQDGRGIVDGWAEPRFDDDAWAPADVVGEHPTATLSHLIGQETRIAERRVRPERMLTADDGTVVADFGRVIPARPVVRFDDGEAGRTVPMRAGYDLTEDGRVDTSTLSTQGTDMSFPYVQAEGRQTYEAFTHLGFRYLEIPDAGERIGRDDVAAGLVHTRTEGPVARFDSSDGTLDAVWDMMQRSALWSVQEAFVDTPTREKGQFLGDAANISYATMQGFGERDATQQAIREFLASQDRFWADGDRAGRYNAVYPNGDGGRDIPDYTEMFVNWVWRYYEVTGDRALLADAYPAILETAGYVRRHIPDDGPTAGLVTDLSGGSGAYRYGIVDWPEPGRFGYDMDTSARTVINALGVEVLRRTADMGEVLGRPVSEVSDLRRAGHDLVDTMNATLRRPDGVYVDGLHADGTQSAHAGQHATSYAVAFGVAPREDLPELADHLVSMGMKQGPMTAHWLLDALAAADRPDAVLALLTAPDDLGWARILDQGGTFTWEAWTLDEGSNFSQSHGWGAQAAVDVMETMLGVRPGTPGGASVVVAPPRTGLRHASGSVPTQRGEVSASWQRTRHGVRLEVDVPVNMTARVELPVLDGVRYRAAGRGEARYLGVDDGVAVFEVGSGGTRFVPVR